LDDVELEVLSTCGQVPEPGVSLALEQAYHV
jgi:hypothetical protein